LKNIKGKSTSQADGALGLSREDWEIIDKGGGGGRGKFVVSSQEWRPGKTFSGESKKDRCTEGGVVILGYGIPNRAEVGTYRRWEK